MAVLAGANIIYGMGMLESGITFDFGQLVMDNEFARMVKHTVNGFSIDTETLAVDIIAEVGPAKDFLMHDHTFRHMRSQSKPELIDRKGMEEWKASGGKDIYLRATHAARDILDNHKPKPLPDATAARLRSIIVETEGELGVDKA